VGVSPFEAPSLSYDGSIIAFSTNAALVPEDTNRTLDVYVQNTVSGAVERVSGGDGRSSRPSISDDGRYVAFESESRNAAPGDDGRGQTDVFLRDRVARTTKLISATPAGVSASGASSHPSISPDGRYVAFQSSAANLGPQDKNAMLDVYVRDVAAATTQRVSMPAHGEAVNLGSYAPAMSNNGLVAFETTEDFGQWFYALSPKANVRDGIYYDRNIVLRSLDGKITRLVSVPPGEHAQDGLAYRPAISADGNTIAFESTSTNLVAGDTNNAPGVRGLMEPDVFVLDRRTNSMSKVSLASDGTQADGHGASGAAISATGDRVAFESDAQMLAAGDHNDALDVFVRDRAARATTRASVTSAGQDPGSAGRLRFGSVSPDLSGDGATVAFATSAPGLIGESGPDAVFGVVVRGAGGVRGPFGIGCRVPRDATTPAVVPASQHTTIGSPRSTAAAAANVVTPRAAAARATHTRSYVALDVGGVLVLAAVAGRRRRVLAVTATVVVALVSSGSAQAHHYSPLQPGGAILHETSSGVASLNFVFRDRTDGTLYIATAAHNVREFSVGDKVPISGYGPITTLVYSREGESFSLTDMALLRVDRDHYGDVDAAVRAWGGPTGVADPFGVMGGEPTFQYGQAAFMRHTQATRAKRGVFEFTYGDRWGWIGWYLHSIAFYGGDSGSPILVGTDGKALGITIATAAGYGEPGTTSGPTTALMLQEMRLVGFDVDLVTAPFDGVGGDPRTVDHCLDEPVEHGPKNEGCVRVLKPGP
jgi:Tol biopolymer transport system component